VNCYTKQMFAAIEQEVKPLMAERDAAYERIAQLEAALNECWREIVASGNAGSKDYGWPACRELFFECFPAQRDSDGH